MSASKNRKLQGKKFHYWTVLRAAPRRKPYRSRWVCICRCGKQKEVNEYHLLDGKSTSCGCYSTKLLLQRIKNGLNRSPSHKGLQKTRAYGTWRQMKSRCYYPSNISYKEYGGKGITICKRWLSFENFYRDMGERPIGMSIDRINPFRGYSPSNCRWATSKQQGRNKKNTIKVRFRGELRSVRDWCDELGLPLYRTIERIKKGWPPHKAFTLPKIDKYHPMSIRLNKRLKSL